MKHRSTPPANRPFFLWIWLALFALLILPTESVLAAGQPNPGHSHPIVLNQAVTLTVTPSVANFGVVAVGGSTYLNIIISSSGITTSGLLTVSVSGTGFGFIGSPCTSISDASPCPVTVQLAPSIAGPYSGTLGAAAYAPGFGLASSGASLIGSAVFSGPSPTAAPPSQGRIYGKVTLNGQPLPGSSGVSVSLKSTLPDGTSSTVGPQSPDAGGNYGFNNLGKGVYVVTINPPAGVTPDGPPSVTVDMSKSVSDSQTNFNLTNKAPAPTATPTGAGPTKNCEEGVGGPAGSIYMITCVQAAGASGVSVHYLLGNNTDETVDVGHSVTFNGGNVVNLGEQGLASTGAFNGSVWNGFELAPGAFATLHPAFQNNNGALFSSVFATVTGKTSGKVYAATLGGFTATSALDVTSLKQVSLPGPNCGPVSPTPGVLDLVVCRAQVNPLPNGGTQYVLKVIVLNGKTTAMDVSKTVEVGVAPGVTVASVTADVGATRTDPGTNTVTWTDYTLDPGATATMTIVLEAPPATAGTSSTTLLNDVRLSAVEAGTGARYEGRTGAFTSTSPVSRTPAQTVAAIPGKLPATGIAKNDDLVSALVELGLIGLILSGLALLTMRPRHRKE